MATATDNTTMSLRTKKSVKKLAQLRAKQLGIPLGTLINAFLRNLGETGEVHFTAGESMTPQMASLLRQVRKEFSEGQADGPFTVDQAEEFLDSIPNEYQN